MNAVFDLPLQLFNHYRLRDRFRCINLLVLDVDGVLTDGGLLTDEEGAVIKRFDVRDGLGILMLQQAGTRLRCLAVERVGPRSNVLAI